MPSPFLLCMVFCLLYFPQSYILSCLQCPVRCPKFFSQERNLETTISPAYRGRVLRNQIVGGCQEPRLGWAALCWTANILLYPALPLISFGGPTCNGLTERGQAGNCRLYLLSASSDPPTGASIQEHQFNPQVHSKVHRHAGQAGGPSSCAQTLRGGRGAPPRSQHWAGRLLWCGRAVLLPAGGGRLGLEYLIRAK